MNTELVAIGLARSSRLHLAEAGFPKTLCGLTHRVNTRLVTRSMFSLPVEDATCPNCKKLKK